ncbi:helix-turn-helix domain-containing protein [Siminovitchia terrae]|uniref:GAF domain-containing protein n=1 Tax=Siminovitchia terrae TaxID=1914933 RepID=A0A429X569_SIMTE|nr:helix-turn-helix domain-containing protein [Siminovitchia terrae]RST58557.1 GAF domain-containing protein [Siminovitchia terrae]GIN89199.1 purine catabolism regulatory protein [Siminovitchia terrae]
MVKLTYEQCQQLFDLNALLTQSLEERVVLQNLMAAAMGLVKRADTVIIYEWNEEGYLTFSAGMGVEQSSIRKVKFRAGESITGRAFQERRIYNVSLDHAKNYMTNMSKKNAAAFQRAVDFKTVQSVLAAPLVYQENCIGVLVVDNFDAPGDIFTEEETLIIKILANQAAIALTNSRLYKELEQRNNDLLTIQNMHHTFSNILLEGSGIGQIVHVLNRLLTQPVTYEETVDKANSVFPIISSNETLGYFRLPQTYESYSNIERVAIEQAANVVVLELIKQNNLFERENKLQEELFLKLLDGTWDHQFTYYSKFNKLTKFSTVACLLVEGKKEPLWLQDSLVSKERILRKLEQALHVADRDAIVFHRGFTVFVLVPDTATHANSKVKQLLRRIFPDTEVVAGIGRKVPVSQIGDSYREANDAIQLAKKSRDQQIIRYEDLGFERLWHGTDQGALTQYISDQIGPLINGDPVDYETLKTYIQLNGRHKETAESLCIHPNTLSYRLRKIEDLLSVDLRVQKDFLKLMTAFDILDYLPNIIVPNTK